MRTDAGFSMGIAEGRVSAMNPKSAFVRVCRAPSFWKQSRWLAGAGMVGILAAAPATGVAETPAVLGELRVRLAEQVQRFGNMETLRASYSTAEKETGIRHSHEFVVRLDGPIQVVSEKHEEDDGVVRKDYFLHESEVYALRVSSWAPSPDGKTARVSESRFLFDKGAPVYRGGVTVRVPIGVREPDFSKAKETPVPLPPGLDGWGAQLKVRAFSIARSFRPHVGQYVFGSWEQWLLKGAPAEDPGLAPPERPLGWMPPNGTRVLPIQKTDSPDGLFRIGWGYAEGPVDWARLAYRPEQPGSFFSTKAASGDLKPPLTEDANFLMNAVSGEPISDIGRYHLGERQRFNHDEILVHWSPSSSCFVVKETQKWGDEAVGVGWIKGGKCEKTFDILEPLWKVADEAVKKSNHPAAKRVRDGDGEYTFGLGKVLVEDDGRFEIQVVPQVPKDVESSGMYEAIVQGTFLPGPGDEPAAVIKNAKVKVLPVRE